MLLGLLFKRERERKLWAYTCFYICIHMGDRRVMRLVGYLCLHIYYCMFVIVTTLPADMCHRGHVYETPRSFMCTYGVAAEAYM